jgi:lysophospholipase L1-like esterase
MNLKNLKINFLGDSITEGAGVSNPENMYVNYIANNYGAICRNYGIGGTRIAKQKTPSECARCDRDFVSRVEEMDSDADVIVIFGGTNDYGHGDAPIGEFNDRTADTFYGALHTLYTNLINKYPEAMIIVLTPLHRWGEEDKRGDNRMKPVPMEDLKTYRDIIMRVAEYYSLPVLDLYANSGIQPNLPIMREIYAPDGLHPNDKGHIKIAKMIAKFIESYI